MIDPELRNKVTSAAVAAARRSQRADLSELWRKLTAIDLKVILDALETIEYPYGAIPVLGSPGASYQAESDSLPVVGIDGSQVYPDWEQPVLWGYIQALAYRLQSPPSFVSDFVDIGSTKKSDGLGEYSIDRRAGADSVNFWRTLLEMRLAAIVTRANADHVILMDYPLLPWIDPDSRDPNRQIREYLDLVEKLKGSLLAGIVSAPKSRLLISLIALSVKIQGREAAPADVSDGALMAYGLPAGNRSAVFKYAGPRNEICKKQGVEIYFFFIRIKDRDVVRVEIPDWLAMDPAAIDKLHASILTDSLALGYPYALAAAHQSVVIPYDVGEALRQLALVTYIREGGFYFISAKKRAKGFK
jgi:hypothetical protein